MAGGGLVLTTGRVSEVSSGSETPPTRRVQYKNKPFAEVGFILLFANSSLGLEEVQHPHTREGRGVLYFK